MNTPVLPIQEDVGSPRLARVCRLYPEVYPDPITFLPGRAPDGARLHFVIVTAPHRASVISPDGGLRRVSSPSDGSDLHQSFPDSPAMPVDREMVSLSDGTLSNIINYASLSPSISSELEPLAAPQFTIDMPHGQGFIPLLDVGMNEYSFPGEGFLPAEAFNVVGAIVD